MTKKHSGKQTVTLMTDAYSQMLTFKSYQTMSLLLFFFFSCALSFQCHWLLYVRYKKQCMVNEAHNGQIWLTCQCRRVKKRRGVREGGEWRVEGEAGERGRLKEMKKGEKRGEERQIEAEGWWPVPYPTTEVAALASAGTAGIRWHATRLAGCDWSRLDRHIHAESRWRDSTVG